ncbi:MAG: hypothetical protein EZS28_010988 [Streblomastix strix]|uniref:Uncharacterized protein n=1 Tax=Streblomastix strix TaxID=222440 RepID=A0A5J4WGK5_9EUKA|nr:MAG: hypothetical protein EZS28_010988 [Streblomastix strix]
MKEGLMHLKVDLRGNIKMEMKFPNVSYLKGDLAPLIPFDDPDTKIEIKQRNIYLKLDSCITSSREGELPLCLLDSERYEPSLQQTLTMSLRSQSQSSSSGTGNKDKPYQDRVRRNVLRLPEFKIHEILASIKFQDTGLNSGGSRLQSKAKGAKRQVAEGFIYFCQIEHDFRLAWAEERHKIKEKDDTLDQKKSKQRELLYELKEFDKLTKHKRSPETNNLHALRGKANKNIINHQYEAIISTRNVLEGLSRTQVADQIPGTGLCRGPGLGLGSGLERRSFKPESVRAWSRWLHDALDRLWRDEHVWPISEPIEQSSIEQTSVFADVSKSLSAAEGSALGALKSVNGKESPTKHITDTYLMILSAGHRFRVIRESANLYGWKRSYVLKGVNQAISRQMQEPLEIESKLNGQNRKNYRNYDYKSNDRRGSRHDYRSHNK